MTNSLGNTFETNTHTSKEYYPALSFELGAYPQYDGYHTKTETVAEYPRGDHGRP